MLLARANHLSKVRLNAYLALQVDPYITDATVSEGRAWSWHDLGHPYGRIGRTKSSIGAITADWIGVWDLIRGAGSPRLARAKWIEHVCPPYVVCSAKRALCRCYTPWTYEWTRDWEKERKRDRRGEKKRREIHSRAQSDFSIPHCVKKLDNLPDNPHASTLSMNRRMSIDSRHDEPCWSEASSDSDKPKTRLES